MCWLFHDEGLKDSMLVEYLRLWRSLDLEIRSRQFTV